MYTSCVGFEMGVSEEQNGGKRSRCNIMFHQILLQILHTRWTGVLKESPR